MADILIRNIDPLTMKRLQRRAKRVAEASRPNCARSSSILPKRKPVRQDRHSRASDHGSYRSAGQAPTCRTP